MVVRIVTLLVCALIASAGAFWKRLHTSKHPASSGSPITKIQVLAQLNAMRHEAQPLVWDEELAAWLEGAIPAHAQVEQVSADELLAKLQDELPSLAAASAGVFRAPRSGPTFFRELEQWMDARDSGYSHAGLVTRSTLDKPGLTNTWAILAVRFPDFAPEKLASEDHEFHHVCARCGKDYNGRFSGGDRILLLRCPHCEQTHDILAVSTANKYQRVNSFLQGFAPQANFPPGMSKLDELKQIWRKVLGHCQYINDTESEYTASKDFWQTSTETFLKQSGDCEDTSILLADWLNARGIDARVVIGETSSLLGHAWCVARLDGITYLLETTIGAKDALSLRRVEDTGEEYRPDYQFDRDHLYFRQSKKPWITDYWSENLWAKVAYPSDDAKLLQNTHSDVKDAWLPSDRATTAMKEESPPAL